MWQGYVRGPTFLQMSVDGMNDAGTSRPPSESGDHPSKEAHKKGRFKVCFHHTQSQIKAPPWIFLS